MPISPGIHPYFKVSPNKLSVTPNELVRKYDVTGKGSIGKDRELEDGVKFDFNSKELENGIIEHEGYSNLKVDTGLTKFTLSSQSSKYTVFWTPDKEKFQCLEPWVGLPDAVGFAALSTEAEGAHPLSAKLLKKDEEFTFDYLIEM